tara:strand:- start:130 stop:360 length:231 start_codon:yes stop_codon:yes gene_type:complete
MRLDIDKQSIRVGSLVMWNRKSSNDYGCMGIVTDFYFEEQDGDKPILEFSVLWADNDRVDYDYNDLLKVFLKVVIF